MRSLIPVSLVASSLLVIGYILGSELCLPTARHALCRGDMHLWRIACRLVAAGEWAVIALCTSFLALADQVWHLFTVLPEGRLLALSAVGVLIVVSLWEVTGHTRKHYARIMSTSLDLVLPDKGRQRECYESLRQQLETGSRAAEQRVLQCLVANRNPLAERL